MRAMVLKTLGLLRDRPAPLQLTDLPDPVASAGEILIEVHTCGVCHTELDEIEGRTPPPELPIVLGHQVVGVVAGVGEEDGRLFDRCPGRRGLDLLSVRALPLLCAVARRICASGSARPVATPMAAMPS